MKAEIQKNNTFAPITVTFTIESQKELTALFYRLHMHNSSIKDDFFDDNNVSMQQLDFEYTKVLHDVIKDALR